MDEGADDVEDVRFSIACGGYEFDLFNHATNVFGGFYEWNWPSQLTPFFTGSYSSFFPELRFNRHKLTTGNYMYRMAGHFLNGDTNTGEVVFTNNSPFPVTFTENENTDDIYGWIDNTDQQCETIEVPCGRTYSGSEIQNPGTIDFSVFLPKDQFDTLLGLNVTGEGYGAATMSKITMTGTGEEILTTIDAANQVAPGDWYGSYPFGTTCAVMYHQMRRGLCIDFPDVIAFQADSPEHVTQAEGELQQVMDLEGRKFWTSGSDIPGIGTYRARWDSAQGAATGISFDRTQILTDPAFPPRLAGATVNIDYEHNNGGNYYMNPPDCFPRAEVPLILPPCCHSPIAGPRFPGHKFTATWPGTDYGGTPGEPTPVLEAIYPGIDSFPVIGGGAPIDAAGAGHQNVQDSEVLEVTTTNELGFTDTTLHQTSSEIVLQVYLQVEQLDPPPDGTACKGGEGGGFGIFVVGYQVIFRVRKVISPAPGSLGNVTTTTLSSATHFVDGIKRPAYKEGHFPLEFSGNTDQASSGFSRSGGGGFRDRSAESINNNFGAPAFEDGGGQASSFSVSPDEPAKTC